MSQEAAAAQAEEAEEDERPAKRPSLLNREGMAETLSYLFRESMLRRDDGGGKALGQDAQLSGSADVQAQEAESVQAAKEGECASKDPPNCRVHGTPLKKQEKAEEEEEEKEAKPGSLPKQWKPLPVMNQISPVEAKSRLKKGIVAKDPLGNDITLDESILTHWQEAHKTQQDIDRRLSYLPIIEQSIKTPAEIWEQDDGTRIYMAAYLSPDEGRIYPLSFTVSNDSARIKTYFPREHSIQNKRKGKLLYQVEQKARNTSGA